MIIFLAHTIFSAGTRAGLLALGVADVTLHLVMGTLAGLILPVMMLHGFSRIASPRWLGA